MKYVIASDIHGSAFYTEKIVEIFKKEKADKLILLGDIYNHGPRNPFPEDYKPMKVSELLNGIKKDLIVIKGNCDSQVDTLISEFDFIENAVLTVGNKTIFLSHGHIYNKDNLPKTEFNAIIYGHFHTHFIEKIGNTYAVNSGSIALPKENSKHSYVVLENENLTIMDVDGNLIDKVTI